MTHSPIHTLTHQWVEYLAQGHFDMQTAGAGDRTTDLLTGGQPPVPEPHWPICNFVKLKEAQRRNTKLNCGILYVFHVILIYNYNNSEKTYFSNVLPLIKH